MRATTVAALLGNTGLFAPVARGSVVPRYVKTVPDSQIDAVNTPQLKRNPAAAAGLAAAAAAAGGAP